MLSSRFQVTFEHSYSKKQFHQSSCSLLISVMWLVSLLVHDAGYQLKFATISTDCIEMHHSKLRANRDSFEKWFAALSNLNDVRVITNVVDLLVYLCKKVEKMGFVLHGRTAFSNAVVSSPDSIKKASLELKAIIFNIVADTTTFLTSYSTDHVWLCQLSSIKLRIWV